MASAPRTHFGFTLIELMVTLTVAMILLLIAVPSFQTFRQRSALRGAAEQAQTFWNQARFEAAKRNVLVKVGVSGTGANFCLGASTASSINDTTPCTCLVANSCDIGVFPRDASEWQGVTLASTPTLGSSNGAAVIEPKRTGLAVPAQSGQIAFAGPTGPNSYRLILNIDPLGRAQVCESTSATHKMSDFTTRRCAP